MQNNAIYFKKKMFRKKWVKKDKKGQKRICGALAAGFFAFFSFCRGCVLW
jgi:hypothetical protein